MAIVDVFPKMKAASYNGGNSAEVLTAVQIMCGVGGAYATADINSGLTNSVQCVINGRDSDSNVIDTLYFAKDYWYIFTKTGMPATGLDSDQLAALYRTAPEMGTVMGSTTTFAAAVQSSMRSVAGAFGSYPNLVVNGLSNANFDVPIRPMMSSTAFTAVPVLTGTSSLLGSLSMTGLTNGTIPTANTANKLSTVIDGVTWYDRVRINVANSGALQLSGAALLVHVTP